MQPFDRELKLGELLPQREAERLCASLGILLDAPVALFDQDGTRIGGVVEDSAEGTELVLELEAVGRLTAPQATPVRRAAAAALIRQLLVARARYTMAAGVHTAAVAADYAELQRQNAALRESEARYKALSEELEQRVAAQVRIIDERQRQLYQAERLASIGQLAAGVAHEINNPIGFVRSNLGTAQKYLQQIAAAGARIAALPPGRAIWEDADMPFTLGDFAELLQDSVVGIDRVARIVSDLKGFSNVDRPEEEIVDLNELFSGACSMVEAKLPAGARLERDFAMLPPTLCLPGHLSQALLAVLDNALQAIAERAEGRIRVASRLEAGRYVLSVEDNGVGIAEADLPRVFDPFFTTRAVGQGSGLGLTVARDIVGAHGGSIEIDSRFGVGTRVRLILPE